MVSVGRGLASSHESATRDTGADSNKFSIKKQEGGINFLFDLLMVCDRVELWRETTRGDRKIRFCCAVMLWCNAPLRGIFLANRCQ